VPTPATPASDASAPTTANPTVPAPAASTASSATAASAAARVSVPEQVERVQTLITVGKVDAAMYLWNQIVAADRQFVQSLAQNEVAPFFRFVTVGVPLQLNAAFC
jgi:hypothetical protein